MVMTDLDRVDADRRDATAYLWGIQRGQETRRIAVYISGSAIASDNEGLPQEVAAAKNTHGRSVLSTLVSLDDPPGEVMVTTAGYQLDVAGLTTSLLFRGEVSTSAVYPPSTRTRRNRPEPAGSRS
jgi:hypothetical protein